jgi:ribonuclease P protein component
VGNKKNLIALRSASDFDSLRKNGKYFHPVQWLLVNYIPNEIGEVRCAWTISRNVGNAVVRNRLRRWGREFLRPWLSNRALTRSNRQPCGLDFNLIFKKRDKEFYRELDHAELDQVLRKVVSRFEQLI